MIASSIGAVPVAPAPPPALRQSASRSQFGALFSGARNAKDDTAERTTSHESKTAGQKGEAPQAAIPVTILPKQVLPITLNVADSQPTEAASVPDSGQETIDIAPPSQPSSEKDGELAFAAKLIDLSGQAPQTPTDVDTKVSTPGSPASTQAIAGQATPTQQPTQTPLPTAAVNEQHVPAPRAAETPQKQAENPHAASSAVPDETHPVSSPSATQPVHAVIEATTPRDVTANSVAPKPVEAPSPSAAVEHVTRTVERPASTQVNEITLRISNADQTSTSIRMVDRSGELHVAVRTTDSQMAETLRGGVEQLTSKLNNSGFSAEVWKPSSITAAARTQSSSDQMSQQQQQSAKDQPRDLSQRNQNNKQKYPDWVEEFYANNQ